MGSAKRAMDGGQDEKVVLACLLHDISNACLIRTDHGYWGAQMIAPYVDEEVAWAVQYHQALRYFADPSVGYTYPESYHRFFGEDFVPPDYIRRDAEYARGHRWYMSARNVTLNDIYFFDDMGEMPDPEIFTDLIVPAFPPAQPGPRFRRITDRAYVADDDLAEQLSLSMCSCESRNTGPKALRP